MPPDPDTATASLAATVYRYSSYDTPFWARENSRAGRWHNRGDGPVQYLSLTTDGAWAELVRSEELGTEDEAAMVSVSMYAVEVDCQMLGDYSTFEKAEAAGFVPEALVDDDYQACQREGARLRALNFSGVLSPSAALPGAVNLTLFGARMASTWGRAPILASSLPAMMLTKGAPPPGLVARVRHVGSTHEGLRLYRAKAHTADRVQDNADEK